MNILITGVTGFVGANLAKRLLHQNYNVVGITRSIRKDSPLKLLEVDGVDLVFGDVRDENLIQDVIVDYRIDFVFHLAAQPIVKLAIKEPKCTFMTNVIGTLNVLEAVREFKVPTIIMSTDKVYGEGYFKRETDALRPIEPYGASKACADIIARVYARTYDLPIVVVRPCNIYGPGDVHERIIPNTIRKCLKGESPIIYKGFTGFREYIYIDDLVDALIFLMHKLLNNELYGEEKVYNIGTGIIKSQEEVVLEILKHFQGIQPKYVESEHVKKEIRYQSMDSTKIRVLGWQPKTTFEEGIRKTVEWWKTLYKKQIVEGYTSTDTPTKTTGKEKHKTL